MPTPIETCLTLLDSPRLLLRRIEAEDQPLLERLFCDADMMRYLGEPWTPEQVKETLHEWREAWGSRDYRYGVLIRKDTAAAIGIAGFAADTHPEEPGLELSWFIVPEQQKRGYATEITQAILEYAFDFLAVERVFAETHPKNIASNRVLEKLHFVNAGERRHTYDYLPGFERQVVWEYTRSNWG
ncbi:MAG TPA: GNAT family N-acetyltransferase [Anaerolineae bacterium]|nr:GNAT family N-acetyltransferase [Anaerolineae bacterium]